MRDRVAPCDVPLHHLIREADEKVTKIFQLIFRTWWVYDKETLKAFSENRHQVNWEDLKILFERYQQNDQTVVRSLFEGLQKKIEMALTQKGLHADDVRELCQDILLKLHTSRERYDAELSLRAWVVTIVEHTVIDFWRKNKRAPIHGLDEDLFAADPDQWVEAQPESFMRLKEILRHIGILKPLDRSIVDMFVMENKSIEEIAKELRLSSGAVKVRLHRARKILKDLSLVMIFIILGSYL